MNEKEFEVMRAEIDEEEYQRLERSHPRYWISEIVVLGAIVLYGIFIFVMGS